MLECVSLAVLDVELVRLKLKMPSWFRSSGYTSHDPCIMFIVFTAVLQIVVLRGVPMKTLIDEDEMPEFKDVFEVMEATRMKINRSPRSRNGNVTSRFDKTDNVDLDFVRQKFMDEKRLSTDESLQMSEEFIEKLDALICNSDLLVEFLQKLNPVTRDLHDHCSPSSTANCITTFAIVVSF